jgi:hypothetical protein
MAVERIPLGEILVAVRTDEQFAILSLSVALNAMCSLQMHLHSHAVGLEGAQPALKLLIQPHSVFLQISLCIKMRCLVLVQGVNIWKRDFAIVALV